MRNYTNSQLNCHPFPRPLRLICEQMHYHILFRDSGKGKIPVAFACHSFRDSGIGKTTLAQAHDCHSFYLEIVE